LLLINASSGGMPMYTGVRMIYADDESFTVMTPERTCVDPHVQWPGAKTVWRNAGAHAH
jgi:hypothetical protein